MSDPEVERRKTLAVVFLGSTLILALAGIVAITALTNHGLPEVIPNIAVGCLGGLLGLLAAGGRGADSTSSRPTDE